MDSSSDEEEDGDSNIDDLLKALDGIEQCFVADFEVPQPVPKPAPLPTVNIKKRSVVEPVPPTFPALKRINLRDPRLQKDRLSSVVPKAPLLPVPNFGYRNEPSKTNASNSKEISPKKSILKPIVISTHLSKYLKFKPSTTMKSKHRSANARRTLSSSRKSHSALLQTEPEKKFEEDITTTENVTVRESLVEMLSKEMRKMESSVEEGECRTTSKSSSENHSNQESLVKILSKGMQKVDASDGEDDCIITSQFPSKNHSNQESLVEILSKEMKASEDEDDCIIMSHFPTKNHSNRESLVKIHSNEMRKMEASDEEDDCIMTSQFPSKNYLNQESPVKIHSKEMRRAKAFERVDNSIKTSQFPSKNYLNRESLAKILSKEMRKRKASEEKDECEITSKIPSKNPSNESSKVPSSANNSKCEETTNSTLNPLSVKSLNFEIIEDLLHKLIPSSSAKETNSVTCDPRIRKLVAPIVNPEELSAGPITSQVCPEIEEQEIVSVSQDPEESPYLIHSHDNIQVVNMSMSEESEDESASDENSDPIERGMSAAKKTEAKQIPCYGNSRLPPEILIKIFQYLPLSDKKRAKLVCRFWYDACTIKSFLMRQRFVCCGIYDTTSILGTLSNSGCMYLNLEFHRVDFCHAFSSHWKQLGPRIHALYFVDCMLAEETLSEVIVNCNEMEYLSLSFERLRVPPAHKLFPRSLFEKLLERRIERPKLLSMDIQINSSRWFSNSILSNLFGIYPNITKLSFTCHSLNPVAKGVEAVPPCDIDFTDLWSSKALTFSPVLKYVLSPPNSMEKLKLDVHTKGMRTGFGWQLVVSHSKFTRLREIAIEIDLKRLSGNAVIEFCIAQTELKTITCKIVGPAKLFISLFLFKLLNNCPRLRNLNVTYKASFILSYELYKRLVACKLKSLSIESSNVQLAPQISGELEWPINAHLRSLSLSEGIGNNFKKLFVSIFRNLSFLEIHNLSDELLQLIWKYQTSLITLKLAGVEECTIDGFCGLPENMSSFSIRNLQNLEYLLLEAVNNEWHVYGNVFSEFQFPKLRYFCVDIEGSSTLQNDLLEAMQNFTELEGVSITSPGVDRSAWARLNRNWKKLRYLRIVDKESSKLKSCHYLKYFKTSPNLRAVFHEFKESTESYYYDILEKTVKRKVHRAKYRISSEKVGTCFVDWLWF